MSRTSTTASPASPARPTRSPGLGFNVLKNGDVLLVPVRTGVGARLGLNIGYLKLTEAPTWNPF